MKLSVIPSIVFFASEIKVARNNKYYANNCYSFAVMQTDFD